MEPLQLTTNPADSTAIRFAPLTADARDLACVRGGRLIFSGLSFSLAPGRLLALVGPNGSGKSSLLRILAGLLRPHSGAFGLGVDDPAGQAHYLGHLDALKPALALRETLGFWAALYRGDVEPTSVVDAAEKVGLGHALDLPVGVLSAGQRRRANLARLLIAPRALWLLDEPGAALDQDGEAMLGTHMRAHLSSGGLVVAATHADLPVPPDAVLDLAQA